MLKFSNQPLGRPLRVDEPIEELGISSYDRLKELIKAGDTKTALKLVDYTRDEIKGLHDLYCDWAYTLLTWIADNCGEEKLPEVMRYCKEKTSIGFYDKLAGIKTSKQMVQWFAEQLRAHRSGPGERGEFAIREEKDRYVIDIDPCGSGGRMRRKGEDGSPSRLEPPYNLGKTKKAYPWSWSLKDVPYYCLHCSIWHEIMAIEASGKPTKITEFSLDPDAPCRFLFYKKTEDIPEKYYRRIGLKKPRKAVKPERK